MSNSTTKFLEGLLLGGLFGYLFGVLSAPKSGADLRRQIADTSEGFRRQAGDQLSELKSRTEHTLQDLQSKGSEMMKRASATRDQIASKFEEFAGQGAQALTEEPESLPNS